MTGIETQNLESLQNVSVIIPSLDPDKRLAGVVEELQKVGFCDIILIDDGSAEKNKVFFPKGDGITLITHEVNRGKGAALKTALKYILENRPNSLGAVTCDGDGQHLAADVKHVCLEMLKSGKNTYLAYVIFLLKTFRKKAGLETARALLRWHWYAA